ncbi:Putative LCCL domain protein (AFU_orthologue; AFUA_5G08630) [Aspergillus calidoustus]|uniref:Putative LCCL domain protein (AFU_orthologue AFUA_5G08630) n=1 Tax=Aspergillus calidoustus TaxID=454130 RepID=A0A0U5FU39_ASPCI|nr:Putative LCCL domain protein (AFU_orthologue; AFUA_5G08630) [Aspergillus calidoustus]
MPSQRSSSSSFERLPRQPEEYLLKSQDDSSNSQSVAEDARDSFDPAPADREQSTSEPLLPTSSYRPAQEPTRRFTCTASGIWDWICGPEPPHKYRINPWLARWQTAPDRLIERYFPGKKSKVALLLAALLVWGVVFISILHASVTGQEIPGHGSPVKLSCWSRLWSNSTNCGLDGDYCRPFDQETLAFRCPAACSGFMVLEPYFVGPLEINYQSLVIGGAPQSESEMGIYRGDSSICQAAIHAGLLDDSKGGCGILRRTGEQGSFRAVDRNGISSVEFPSNFPLSFTFDTGESLKDGSLKCQDLRWPLFTFSVIVSTLFSLVVTSPAGFYSAIFFIVYFQVALSSDPPYSPDYYEIVSTALGRFLPCAFVGFAIYYFAVRHTLKDLDAHWDKTVLWLGPCWVGALNTDTFDKIPISRLTPHDLQQQPGAIPALIIIILILLTVVITQALAFRNEGRLPKMLAVYGTLVAGVLALLAVPNMNLRIHHYILALLFLPGTTLQTRPSLLYQGLLMGLFINGIARWGFDSILQTSAALLDGAQLGSLLPEITTSLITFNSDTSLSFSFESLSIPQEVDGLSVLINDVERYHAFRSDGAEDVKIPNWNWTRVRSGEPEYFRFGYIKENALGGFWYQDFTDPVTWVGDGAWNGTSA